MPNVPTTQTGSLPALTEDDIALMVAAQGDVEQASNKTTSPPFLFIVQGTHDYIKRGEAKFIEAARVGDIMDSLALTPMQEAWVIPCKFEEHSSEWKPNRGGLVKQYWTDHSHYRNAAKKGADDFDGMPRVNAARQRRDTCADLLRAARQHHHRTRASCRHFHGWNAGEKEPALERAYRHFRVPRPERHHASGSVLCTSLQADCRE